MSKQQWPAPTRPPGGGGSVRRAREMAEQGIAPQMPTQIPRPPPQRPYDPVRDQSRAYDPSRDPLRVAPNAPTPRMRPPMPPALASSKSGQGPIGVAISRPTQVPQWPLAATIENGPDPQYQPPPGRGVPPQRPPRPSHVPSMLDASRLQDPTPSFRYPPEGQRGYEEDDVISPTQSSRPSTLSSVGSIPDFPVPMPPPGPPRRSANLGPPPSSRRGASSYYSQASFVSPIPEESPRTAPSHQSYASSAAMPTSWGSDSPRYDEDDYEDEEIFDGESPGFRRMDRGFTSPIEEGRESRESNGDDSDDRGLIRSASFGRRAKPSIITTRSAEKIEPARPQPVPQQNGPSKLEKMGIVAGLSGPTTGLTASKNGENGQRETVWPIIGDVNSPLATGTGLIDKSSTSSEETVPTIARAVTTNEPSPAYVASRSDPKAAEMLGAYNAASSLQPSGPSPTRTPSPGFSRLSAIRRPPRLDMDAVRDAEARGSLTSLPDLIRRATRLAAMMDRGKRPGSRMALNDWPSDGDLMRDKELGLSEDEKHKSGLSGMLAAFPPPGVATPVRGNTPIRPVSSWPSPYDQSDPSAGVGQSERKKKRRCCGLPCWGFLLVLLILLIIIAAAVVVPLELLVFHKANTASATPDSALQQCEANTATACQNGGTSVIDSGSCACICTNGFTGTTCTSANATGCTTTTLSGSDLTDVTLGDSIARLISDAQTNFSIPLSGSTILARFNNANLTCAAENALVTFDGQSSREGAASDIVAQKTNNKRGDTTSSASWPVGTSAGIIYESSSPPTKTSTSTPTSSPTSSSSSTSATPNPSTNPLDVFNITQEVLDFARVSVLFILQQEQLNAAITAQSALQKFFSLQSFTNMAAGNVSLGNGNVVDLLGFRIDLGEGVVGGRNSTGSGGSRKREVEDRGEGNGGNAVRSMGNGGNGEAKLRGEWARRSEVLWRDV